MSRAPVIRVSGIRKTYGRTVAVDDVSFEVPGGQIFGLIGPNGAGKTTTMECVEGLRRPDHGRIEVFGLDPMRDARALDRRLGVQLQEAQLQKRIKVWEAVDLWASLFDATTDTDQLLDQLGLSDKRNAWFMTLSGGQKQRLFIALALINDPELVFLDELTTGLDPQARHTIWDLVRDIPTRGKTVFLTTHLMEEAERLCDHVAIIAIYRESGILKRLRATPLSPITILVAHVLVKLIMTAVTVTVMILVGRRYYPAGTDVPVVSFTLALLLSTWSILSLGFIIASLVRTARFAPPLGSLVLYSMLPFCGLFRPIDDFPAGLQIVARALPLTPTVSLLSGIWQGHPWSAHLGDVAALVAVFAICTLIASRVFRWE